MLETAASEPTADHKRITERESFSFSLRSDKFTAVFLPLFAFSSCFSISGTYLITLILFATFVVDALRKKLPKAPPVDFSIIGSIYIWRAWSVILHRTFNYLNDFWEILEKFPYFVTSCYSYRKKHLLYFFHTLFIANCIIVVWFLIQFYYDHEIQIYQQLFRQYRMLGFFGNSLHYSGYISLVIILCFSLAVFFQKRFYFYIPLLITGSLYSESRSYFLGIFFAVLYLTYRRSKKFFLFAILILLLIYAATPYIAPLTANRVYITEQSYPKIVYSLQYRLSIWDSAISAAKENPILGTGWHSLPDYFYEHSADKDLAPHSHAHNVFLNELSETGPLGCALMLFFFSFFYAKYRRVSRTAIDNLHFSLSLGIAACFINLVVAGLFEQNFGAAVVWIPFTLIMGLINGYKTSFPETALPGAKNSSQ